MDLCVNCAMCSLVCEEAYLAALKVGGVQPWPGPRLHPAQVTKDVHGDVVKRVRRHILFQLSNIHCVK